MGATLTIVQPLLHCQRYKKKDLDEERLKTGDVRILESSREGLHCNVIIGGGQTQECF